MFATGKLCFCTGSTSRATRWGGSRASARTLRDRLGCAYVEALQGQNLADGVLATAKHMVGHGLAEGGRNQAPAHIGPRELRDEQLLPFEAAVRHAGIASVMPAYCDVDGVPCTPRSCCVILQRGLDGIVA
jgi:beta-glucosidase